MTLPIKMAIVGSAVGVAAIACVLILDVQSTRLLLTLWPTSVLGIGYNGGQPVLSFVLGTLEVVGNATIYGLISLMIGHGIQALRQGVR